MTKVEKARCEKLMEEAIRNAEKQKMQTKNLIKQNPEKMFMNYRC